MGLDEISGVNKIGKTKKVVFIVFASVVRILREQEQNYSIFSLVAYYKNKKERGKKQKGLKSG